MLQARQLPNDFRLMVDSAWLFDAQREGFDAFAAANKLQQAGEIAEKWNNTEIAVECLCSSVVMLDEYAEDVQGAIRVLDSSAEKRPKNLRLLRQRAKVHFNSRKYSEALETYTRVVSAIPKGDHIERAFALREAAISAGKTGRIQEAGDYFSEAHKAARNATGVAMQRMAIGLKAECAIVKFQSDKVRDSILLVRQAIIDAEQLDSEADKKGDFCRLMLLHVVNWMKSRVNNTHPTHSEFAMVVGSCSRPDPPDSIMEAPCPPLLASWYHLAILELVLEADYGILFELRKRTGAKRIMSCEVALNYYLMTKYVKAVDIESFLSYLPEYAAMIAYMRENISIPDNAHTYEITNPALSEIGDVDWTSELHLQNAKDAILAMAACGLCSGTDDLFSEMRCRVARYKEAASVLCPFMDCFEKEKCAKHDGLEVTAYCLGRLMKPREHMNPDEMFLLTYRLWEWLLHTFFKGAIENMIANHLEERWQRIADRQQFLLKQPMIAVPAIKSAIEEPLSGTAKIARLLLAAEIAVEHQFDASIRSRLNEDTEARREANGSQGGEAKGREAKGEAKGQA